MTDTSDFVTGVFEGALFGLVLLACFQHWLIGVGLLMAWGVCRLVPGLLRELPSVLRRAWSNRDARNVTLILVGGLLGTAVSVLYSAHGPLP